MPSAFPRVPRCSWDLRVKEGVTKTESSGTNLDTLNDQLIVSSLSLKSDFFWLKFYNLV